MSSETGYSTHLLKEIPDIFHPFITHVQDVNPDGHCGFRSIALCLGLSEDQWPEVRYQLLDELCKSEKRYRDVFEKDFDRMHESLWFVGSGRALEKNWLIMPATGLLIANRFGIIVHLLSKRGSNTCFPLWKSTDEIQDHRALTIANIYGNHYVMVRLEGEYPMSYIIPLWDHHRYECAVGWKSMYMERIEMYTQLLPRVKPDFMVIDK